MNAADSAGTIAAVSAASIPGEVTFQPRRPTLSGAWLWPAVATLIALGAGMTVVYWRFSYDDAFITYRYAYNLATGHGYVYNPGERYLGTTAPLYGLLLALLGWGHPDAIPLLGSAVSGVALTLTGLALLWMGRQAGQTVCGFLAGVFYIVNLLPATTFGGEMIFQVMLIAWAFVLYRQGRTMASAALLAAAVLTRPDALAAVVVIAAHSWVFRRARLRREGLFFVLLLLPFLLACRAYYGTFLPETIGSKVAQVQSGVFPAFWSGVIASRHDLTTQAPDTGGFLFLAAVGLFFVARLRMRPAADGGRRALDLRVIADRRFGFWLLPLCWVSLYVVSYVALDAPFYFWYLVPVCLGVSLLAATGLAALTDFVAGHWQRLWRVPDHHWIAVLPAVLALALLVRPVASQFSYGQRFARSARTVSASGGVNVPDIFARESLYRAVGLWLKANTPPDASVGYLEIGYIGYYSQRRIIDPLGLVNPGVTPHVAARDFGWAFQTYRPDYIVDCPNFNFVDSIALDSPWFRQQYRPVGQVTVPRFAPVTIYRRQ